ncbi:tripartite tricarboxylate transporter substrate binding protein [Alcaligenaceae bacterium]|nr:tripartite tricarboxylate transporter substrate binding protein [Alcaligenaceae bacterium]
MKIKLMSLVACGAVMAGLSMPALAGQGYPDKPVKIVLPYSPGTGLDAVMRPLAAAIERDLKQPVVVENRPGSNGVIGTQLAARSDPDGYTVLATTQSHYTNGMLYENLTYDPNEFVPVARFAVGQMIVVSGADTGIDSIPALMEKARKSPGKMSYASIGRGSSADMAGTLFNHLAQTRMLHVPYKDASQALIDTARGEVSVNFVAIAAASSQIKDGKLRPIAVTGAKRSQFFPDVPTIEEAGLTGYDVVVSYLILMPKGTPSAIAQKFADSVMRVADTDEFRKVLNGVGLEQRLEDSKDLSKDLPGELAQWRKIVELLQGGN